MPKKPGRKPLNKNDIKMRIELMEDYNKLMEISQRILNSYKGTIIRAESMHSIVLLGSMLEWATLRNYSIRRKMCALAHNRKKRRKQ